MTNRCVAQAQVNVNASISDVWDALINPAKMKKYLFGCDAVSDWKAGSEILFKGEYDGTTFEDRGIIKEINTEKEFSYLYWSPFMGVPDLPENYIEFNFFVKPGEGFTVLEVVRTQNIDKDAAVVSEEMRVFLESIRKVIEE